MSKTETIPIIEMGDPQDPEFYEGFGRGLERIGFVILIGGHGISASLLERAYAIMDHVFGLPLEQKLAYENTVDHQTGYTPLGVEKGVGALHPDLKEFWMVQREGSKIWPNIWPDEVPDFRTVMLELYGELDALSMKLLGAISLYLGIDQDTLPGMARGGTSVMRPIWYPGVTEEMLGMRSAPHEDINLITLLPAATRTGLQVLTRDGIWIPANNPPNAILVNVGDMLEWFTYKRFPATKHKVERPTKPDDGRKACPFFVHCRPEVQLVGDPTAGAFLMNRLRDIGNT